ncbi:MAG: LUD domain-containing protein, partial [Spirochaetota bacterium]
MNEPNERKKFYELKINQAIKNFKKRQFEAEYFETSDKLVEFLFSQFKKEDVIGYGGSKSVYGLDIIEKLKDSDYILLDRTHPENTPEKKAEIERKCFSA